MTPLTISVIPAYLSHYLANSFQDNKQKPKTKSTYARDECSLKVICKVKDNR